MEENIQVGKYTLESLTTGMYSDPKIIYREYIQNSVDALEMAVQSNLLEPQSMRIDIIIDADQESNLRSTKHFPALFILENRHFGFFLYFAFLLTKHSFACYISLL